MTGGDVSMAIGPNRQESGRFKAARDENEAVPKNRPGDHRVSLILDSPNFPARGRIVGTNRSGAGTDDLLLSICRDQERGAKGKLLQGLRIPSGLPEHGSLGAVQGDHERLVGTVAVKDQGAVGEDGRAAVSVNRLVMDVAVRPDQIPFRSKQAVP